MDDDQSFAFEEHLRNPDARDISLLKPGAYGDDLDPRVSRPELGFNARDFGLPENIAHVEDLKRSIAVQGVLNPVRARVADDKDAIFLTDGESRWRATMAAIAFGIDIKGYPTSSNRVGSLPRSELSTSS